MALAMGFEWPITLQIIYELMESAMAKARKARAVGFNHVALEVGDIDDALAFYGRLFDFNFGARAPLRPSSTWATDSSPETSGSRAIAVRSDRHPFRFQKGSGRLDHIAGIVIAFCSRLA